MRKKAQLCSIILYNNNHIMVTLKVPNENGPDVIMVLVVGTIAMSMFLGFLLAGWRAGGHHDRNCLLF